MSNENVDTSRRLESGTAVKQIEAPLGLCALVAHEGRPRSGCELEQVVRCMICGATNLGSVDTMASLYQCGTCQFIFRNPRPSEARIARYYSTEDQYDDWLKNESARDELWRRRLRMLNRYRSRGRLLDVGAGIGQFLNLAKEYYEVEGTEVSASAVRIANEKYGLHLNCGRLEDIDFRDRRFDVITLFHVLEHVGDPKALLLKCAEILSPDGIIVIAVPNEIRGWKRPLKSAAALLGLGRRKVSVRYGLAALRLSEPGEEIHLSFFTSRTIETLLTAAGLKVIDHDVDPCHASTGMKQLLHEVAFRLCKALRGALGFEFQEAIWMVARKQ